MKYDLVVVGAGPGGYYAAIHAAKKGLKVVLVEQDKIGGTCLNYGCMPTKIMLDAVAPTLEKHPYKNVTFERDKMFQHRNESVDKLSGGVGFLLKKNKVEIIRGVGGFLDSNHLEITENSGEKQQIEFINAIIATGSSAKSLPFLEGHSEFVMNSNQATNMMDVPSSICIIGGGVIGVEFGYIYKGLGSDVTIIEVLDRLLINEEPIVSDFVLNHLKEKGIRVITGLSIHKIRRENSNVVVEIGGEEILVQKILCSVGRTPNIKRLNVSVFGDDFINDKGSIIINNCLQTKHENIYAIGDVTGGTMLAHTASAQGIIAVNNILHGNQNEWDSSFVPRCVYLEPEIASVGIVENEVKGKVKYSTILYPYGAIGKAIALKKENGFVKVIVDDVTRQIIGMTIVGERATDMICYGMEIIKNKTTIDELKNGIFPHPTFSEILHEAILKVDDDAIHF